MFLLGQRLFSFSFIAAIMGKDRQEMLNKFDSRISKLVPADLLLPRGSPEEEKIASLLRWYYMKNKPASEENLVDYFNVSFLMLCLFLKHI